MKETHPSEENFFDRGPERGTPEFEEVKKEAGAGNWFAVFKRNVERARKEKDQVLLENAVRDMEENLSDVVAEAMKKGNVAAARAALNELDVFAREERLDIKEILESQQERVAQERLEELETMGVTGIMKVARELFRSDEPFNEDDARIIFGLARSLIKKGIYESVEDAIIEAAIRRQQARPDKSALFVAADAEGRVGSSAKGTRVRAAMEFREKA
jgi:hypothetical protein